MKRKKTPPKAPGASGKSKRTKGEKVAKPAKAAASEPQKREPGRPSKYKPEFVEQAAKLCTLGATDADLASFFAVDVATINRWKTDFPEFCDSIKRAKVDLDQEVERSLFFRAKGYSHPSVKILQYEGSPVEVPYTEHYPPDTGACIFWLKNRQPAKWRDKVEHVGGSQPHDAPIAHTLSMLSDLRAQAMAKMRLIVDGSAPPAGTAAASASG